MKCVMCSSLYVGPNDLSLYQFKCADTYELGNKLILYYNAKVSMCISL